MRVMGCDYSTRYVDLVTVPLDGTGAPEWHRFPLTGADAFDRARSVADAMPGRTSQLWDDVLCVGIEHPAGHHGTGPLLRVQGAILARIPARMLVHPLPPGKWRTLAGLPGNASKSHVKVGSFEHILNGAVYTDERGKMMFPKWVDEWHDYPEDAHDAHLIALATRRLLEQQAAA